MVKVYYCLPFTNAKNLCETQRDCKNDIQNSRKKRKQLHQIRILSFFQTTNNVLYYVKKYNAKIKKKVRTIKNCQNGIKIAKSQQLRRTKSTILGQYLKFNSYYECYKIAVENENAKNRFKKISKKHYEIKNGIVILC